MNTHKLLQKAYIILVHCIEYIAPINQHTMLLHKAYIILVVSSCTGRGQNFYKQPPGVSARCC